MSRKKKNKDNQINVSLNYIFFTICFIAICLGYFLGSLFNGESSISASALYSAISRASSSNASSSNASSSNASSSNASSSNASSSNASSSNASSSNASHSNASNPNTNMTSCVSDNVMIIDTFTFGKNEMTPGSKVPVEIVTNGAQYNGASISFVGASSTFTVKLDSNSDGHFFVAPTNLVSGTYRMNEFVINGLNCDGSSFAKHFTYTDDHDAAPVAFDTLFTYTNTNVTSSEAIVLDSLSLSTDKAKVGEMVYVNVKATPQLKSLKLKFVDGSGKVLNAYVKYLNKKPYFEIPSNTETSTYTLVNAVLETYKLTAVYDLNGADGANPFPFSSTLTVEENDKDVYIYNNEDINANVIKDLYKTKNNVTIVVNADSATIINSELFNVIKGTNKKLVINNYDNQFVFNGNDITNPKAIDVNINVEGDNTAIYKLVDDCVILSFADNGELPGKTLIRVKATDEMNKMIADGKAYVYVYNEGSHDFCEIANNISKTKDGYYEFNVTHNSDYILVDEKLDSDLVAVSSDVVTFQKSDLIYLLLICVGGIVIIVLILVIINLKKKNNTNNKKDDNKEDKKEEKTEEVKEEKKDSTKEENKKEDK